MHVPKICSSKSSFFSHFDRRFIFTKVRNNNYACIIKFSIIQPLNCLTSANIPYNSSIINLLCLILQFLLIYLPSQIYQDNRYIILVHIYSLFLNNHRLFWLTCFININPLSSVNFIVIQNFCIIGSQIYSQKNLISCQNF